MTRELLLASWLAYLMLNILEAIFVTSIWNVVDSVSTIEKDRDIKKYIQNNYSRLRKILPFVGLLLIENLYFRIFFFLTLPLGFVLCHFLGDGVRTITNKISLILPLLMMYEYVTVSIELKRFYSGTSQ